MNELQQSLHSYEGSIARLQTIAEGRLTQMDAFGAGQHTRTPADNKRLTRTLYNLQTQQRIYQHELEVLQEYGC